MTTLFPLGELPHLTAFSDCTACWFCTCCQGYHSLGANLLVRLEICACSRACSLISVVAGGPDCVCNAHMHNSVKATVSGALETLLMFCEHLCRLLSYQAMQPYALPWQKLLDKHQSNASGAKNESTVC